MYGYLDGGSKWAWIDLLLMGACLVPVVVGSVLSLRTAMKRRREDAAGGIEAGSDRAGDAGRLD